MRALVTGGAGFIGSNLVDALLARGDEVTVLDDLSTGRRSNLDAAIATGATFVEGSVTDAGDVDHLFSTVAPELVFHLAAQMDVRRSIADPAFDLDVNIGGTVTLLEALRQAGTGRIVFASTGGAIYGEGTGLDLPLTEDADCRPDAPYGQSKLAAEGYVDLYGRLHGVSGISLRLGNVYGPRQDPLGEAGVVAIFCGALLGGGTPKVFGDGRQTRDYIYVDDVVAALIAAAGTDASGEYNVGTGRETDVLKLGAIIGELVERRFEPSMEPPRPGEVQRISIDPARAGLELDWAPSRSLEEGLRPTVDWAREEGDQPPGG
jgi:UDP-glucose 4-epimerase